MKYIYAFVLLALFSSCNSSTEEKTRRLNKIQKNENLYVVNLDSLGKKVQLNLSELFEDIKIIALETSEECLIGNIDRMESYNDTFIIIDSRKTRAVLMFDHTGRFLRRVGTFGNGPGEYTEPIDCTIDKINNILYVLDSRQFINVYNLSTGEFIKRLLLDRKNNRIDYIQYVEGFLYANNYSFDKTKENYLLQELDVETGESIGFELDAKLYNKGWSELYSTEQDYFTLRNSDKPKYIQLFMDTIIQISKEGLMPYLVVKSKHLPTFQEMKRLTIDNISDEMLNNDKIYNINSYIENNKFILFKYNKGFKLHTIYLNLEDNIVQEVYLNNDILYKENTKDKIPLQFRMCNSEGAYECFDEYNKDRLFTLINNKEINININGISELINLPEDTNPIIFYYKYKQ